MAGWRTVGGMMQHALVTARPSGALRPQSFLDARWKALAARDACADGVFVYGVTSTGVYCRPSCPSRRPRADRVRFFDTPEEARRAGFRACRRCRPDLPGQAQPGAAAIRRLSAYLSTHAGETLTLGRMARLAGLSPSHLQRRFKALVGLSPREFQAAVRAGRLRALLRDGRGVTTAIYEAGYGSPSRAYEAGAMGRGVTPSRYRQGGAGMRIAYATLPSPLGRVLVAATTDGVCAVKIGDTDRALVDELRREYPGADLRGDEGPRAEWVEAVRAHAAGATKTLDLPIDVRATAFQWRVWRELQRIPYGETRAYAQVAKAIGRPRAVRAVARACATNPVCLVVPCHRVVRGDGSLAGYRWGVKRKRRLLERERR